jgi:lysophospholipase L1-like esterase
MGRGTSLPIFTLRDACAKPGFSRDALNKGEERKDKSLRTLLLALLLGFMGNASIARAQSADHWIATWGTSQDLAPTVPDPPNVPATVKRPNFAGNRPNTRPVPPIDIHEQTVRMIARIGVGGKRFRVELSNAFGRKPVEFGSIHIARKGEGTTIVAGTDHSVTFSGRKDVQIFPGAVMTSDPIDLDMPDLTSVTVSLYVKKSEGAPTTHALALHTTYISEGDTTASVDVPAASTTTTSYLWLSGIDVLATRDRFSIVTLGDSITDGFKTTVDTDRAWPAVLQQRLLTTSGSPKASVLNQGISGNQVLRDGAGVSALARFDRDVLSRPGVKWVVLLEGINDINTHGQIDGEQALTAADLIAGYQQLISRAHVHNIKVMGATLTPEEGVWLAGPIGEATRLKVNEWIRTRGNLDAVVDFDKVLRTPDQESKLRAEYDPGDHIHPNDEGNAAMARQFSLADFKK